MVGADWPENFSNLIPSILAKKHSFFVNKPIKIVIMTRFFNHKSIIFRLGQ